jgi:tripartite-type tricarboxylate transporter receptor subunit TctC
MPMGIPRRDVLRLSAGLAALPVASRLAFADTYPSRPVRVLVATSAGGSTDIIGRLVAQYLTEKLGQPFFIENRPGGGNNIGTEMAAHAPPDGYTLFMANSVNAINNSLYENLNYVFLSDFVPIVNTMTSPCLMMVHPSVPAKTAAEFIALAKANPGKINMGSGGVGSTGHLGGELLQMMAGIKLAHVPYRGEAPAMTDLIAGHCQMVIATTGSAMEYCKAGSVRAIAVTLDMKLDALPDVKPLSDLLPGYMAIGWSGLVAPKNVPADIVALLHKHASDALAQPNIRQRVIDMGGVVPGGTAADFGRFMAEDTERWAKVIKVAGIKVN